MKSVYFRLNCFEFKVINYIFKRFYKTWFDKYEDIAPLGYIALLEHKKDYENIKDERQKFFKACSYCSAGMQKFFDSYSVGYFETISLTELTERHTDASSLYNNIEELENYNLLKSLFNEVLAYYSLEDKKIIFDYMFNSLSKTAIYTKYKINRNYLKQLVVDVRKLYFDKLVENDYFSKSKKIYNFNKDFEKVEKLPDVLICKLLKQNKIPIEDIARVSGVEVDKVLKILMHTNRKLKFFLFQIQKLRKAYFPEYSLKELAEWQIWEKL